MNLADKIKNTRKLKGHTQEELAELSGTTVRTIQRIETGETTPRAFTLKAIAKALNISYEDFLTQDTDKDSYITLDSQTQNSHAFSTNYSITILHLAGFLFLIFPLFHFLILQYIFKKSNISNPKEISFCHGFIKRQMVWSISLVAFYLVVVCINIATKKIGHRGNTISYLLPLVIMYMLNSVYIIYSQKKHQTLQKAYS